MGNSVIVDTLPICDICKLKQAKYDTKTIWGGWANLCEDCYPKYGIDRLGTGYGQELILKVNP